MTSGDDSIGVRVTVSETKGSAPRDAGTSMWVTAEGQQGTIGGGKLEFQATEQARKLLASDTQTSVTQTYALGPLLDQCCGGTVVLTLEKMPEAAYLAQGEIPNRHALYMFGAGHVGRAVYRAVAPLPFDLHWFDERVDEFPPVECGHVNTHGLQDPVAAVNAAPAGALYLIFTHSHPLDYELVKAVLARGDARYCGLIGSKTKRARFENKLLRERVVTETGLEALTCPIGVTGIDGKEPEVIAAGVAAQLLQHI
ncbi:xanthine dehydrogenase accessory protein XdhC [Kordiimonas gwangyangensis]|uniref:xanthine dehydrogenase accessory protein XdhC n=1 Tax=Kordiimonas gwangyangensis TaxID=288022 RepID=UPI0003814F85|nr:xanthine dehydrogenase accessory protein XdhC [Kordiimonas gwangyangensis]